MEGGGVSLVLTDNGRNRIRDAINTDFSSGQTGTGTFPPEISQTALFFPIAATLNALSTKIVSAETITVTHVVTTGEGNSSYFSEWEILGNSDATDYNRIVRPGLLKTSNTQITMIQSFNIERI